jgi:probable F420-dependent oxidoreductase
MSQTVPEVGVILALTIRGLAIHDYNDMRRVVQDADRLGFDSIWLCDHFLTLSADHYTTQAGVDRSKTADETPDAPASRAPPSIPLLECWTALAALSRETERLRLGTSVLCNGYRNPAVLAKMAATLDVISGGRVDLGLGAGWFQAEFEAYGFPFPAASVRIAQLEEALRIIRAMWSEKNPVFRGDHFSINGALCDPPPVQKPHPPIWIGGEGDKVHTVAAKLASGVNIRWWSPERFRSRREFLRKACIDAGRDPNAIRMSATLLVIASEDPEEIERQRSQFAAIPADGIIAGTAEHCADRLRQYRQAGVEHFLLSIPHVETSGTLRLVGERVLPALRAN